MLFEINIEDMTYDLEVRRELPWFSFIIKEIRVIENQSFACTFQSRKMGCSLETSTSMITPDAPAGLEMQSYL